MADERTPYMVLQDLKATHMRRIRIMVLAASLFLIAFGAGMALAFVARREWFVVIAECMVLGVGILTLRMALRNQLRSAALILTVSLLVIFVGFATFMDIPSAAVPRAIHHGLIPLAVVSYMMLDDESKWIHHGLPLICLVAAVFFSSSDFGVVTQYAVADSARAVGNWVINIGAFGMLYLLLHIFMGDINRMERFLHNANNRFVGMVGRMFPQAIAERLLATGNTFAERHENCSILFADIVGFTGITQRMKPEELVDLLAEIFMRFDQCVERHGLTKIKTIGDAYMVASGVPDARDDHASVLVRFAQEMLRLVEDRPGIKLRIGIASGDLVAGVIGQSRQVYDVWGDVVNTASRMESHGLPGRIQVSQDTYRLTQGAFSFEQRRDVVIKGKEGVHNVYVLA